MNKNLIILAQATATFLRAAADALIDLLGQPPASPEAAASPAAPAEPEAPKATRGRKPKATPEPQPGTTYEPSPELKEATKDIPVGETFTTIPADTRTTEERFEANKALIQPILDALKGPVFRAQVITGKYGLTSMKDIPADRQAEFEADLAAFKAEHGIKEGAEGY